MVSPQACTACGVMPSSFASLYFVPARAAACFVFMGFIIKQTLRLESLFLSNETKIINKTLQNHKFTFIIHSSTTRPRGQHLGAVNMTKKITLATVKSFIRKTPDLHIMVRSRFDGSVDGVMPVSDQFDKAERTERHPTYTQGVQGAWFVGQSRDRFSPYEDERMVGIKVYNCCGSFILATPKK